MASLGLGEETSNLYNWTVKPWTTVMQLLLNRSLTINDFFKYCMILTEKSPSKFFRSAIQVYFWLAEGLLFLHLFLTIIFRTHQITINFYCKWFDLIYIYLSDNEKIQHRNTFCLAWRGVYGFSKTQPGFTKVILTV